MPRLYEYEMTYMDYTHGSGTIQDTVFTEAHDRDEAIKKFWAYMTKMYGGKKRGLYLISARRLSGRPTNEPC